jgi:hypothetical protein
VFDAHDYHYLPDDGSWPATIEELRRDEEVRYGGTHSILDVCRIVSENDSDDYGTLRPLSRTEQIRYFGTATPTAAEFDDAYALRGPDTITGITPRWRAHSVCLHDREGEPTHIAIWGCSGD